MNQPYWPILPDKQNDLALAVTKKGQNPIKVLSLLVI